MWFIGVEVEQETSAPPPKKNPGSAPALNPSLNLISRSARSVPARCPHYLNVCGRLFMNKTTDQYFHNFIHY